MNFLRLTSVFRVLLLAAGLSHTTRAASEVTSLVDKNGATISARLVSSDGTNLTITRESDQKTFAIPLARLNDASQAAVKTWISQGGNLSEHYGFDVEVGKYRKTNGMDDFDDKRINLDPMVTIRNPDTQLTTHDGKMTALFLGRPVTDSSGFFVFKKVSLDLPKLEPLGSKVFPIGKFTAAYDDRGYAKFGARYLGYVIIIHDATGKKIYDSTSIPSTLVTGFARNFMEFQQGQIYDRNFKVATKE